MEVYILNELEKEHIGYFYIIEADRDGERKYISKSFPRVFQYTKKILKAQRFNTEELALRFVDNFNNVGKYVIVNPEVKKVRRVISIE